MRHHVRGRKLGRNASHRKAMFRNMACSLIRTVRPDEDDKQKPKVPGRIVTTLPKAKELRSIVEKLITLARKALPHEEQAAQFSTSAERNTEEWKNWRESNEWNQWNQAIAPAVAIRRRVFSMLRDKEAVDVLFDELAPRFQDRPGGYTRVIRLAKVRLGDAGQQALIEFVGERDRVKKKRTAPVVTDEPDDETDATPADEAEAAGSGAAEVSEDSAAQAESAEAQETTETDSDTESKDEQ